MKKNDIEEIKENLLGKSDSFSSKKPQLAAALSRQLPTLPITVPSSMKYLIEGFQHTLNATSREGKYIDIEVEETGSDLNLETLLTGKILKSNKNLIDFFRENNQPSPPINQSLNDLIIAAIALTSFQLVEINFVLMDLIGQRNKQNDPKKQLTGYKVKNPETADTAINFFLETKASLTRTRCLRYGYHGPFALFALTDSEFKQIREYCVGRDENKIENVKQSLIDELKKDPSKNCEFISSFEKSETLHELQQAYKKYPYNFKNAYLSLAESFKKTPSIGIEENTSAAYYYSKK